MIKFLAFVIVDLIGLVLIWAFTDRFWGTKILGKIVPPRSVLIYEGRPWWMRTIGLFITLGVLVSVLILTSWWIFMSSALNELIMPLGTLWAIILTGVTIVVLSEKIGGNK